MILTFVQALSYARVVATYFPALYLLGVGSLCSGAPIEWEDTLSGLHRGMTAPLI